MPIETIQVSEASKSVDDWTLIAGADKAVAVNAPDDGDTTCIESTAQNQEQRYTLASHSIPANATIAAFQIRLYRKRAAAATASSSVQVTVELGGTVLNSFTVAAGIAYGIALFSFDRPGGGPWTVNDLAAIEIGVIDVNASQRARVSGLHAIVYWIEGGDEEATLGRSKRGFKP